MYRSASIGVGLQVYAKCVKVLCPVAFDTCCSIGSYRYMFCMHYLFSTELYIAQVSLRKTLKAEVANLKGMNQKALWSV